MMITRVRLAHVRGIKNLELDLNERTTILIGQPATGKSTVLDALSIGLAVTGRLTRNFEKRDAGGTGTEPSIEIETKSGSGWRRQGLNPTRTDIRGMTTADTNSACIRVCGRRARPIKPKGAQTRHNPWWRAAEAARTILTIGDAGPFDPEDGARWSHGQAKVMELFTSIALALWNRHAEADDPLAGAGVAVIDDLDALLHPETQRLILPALRRAFPRIQIIGSTHSPIALTSLRPGQIMKLSHQQGGVAATCRNGADDAP